MENQTETNMGKDVDGILEAHAAKLHAHALCVDAFDRYFEHAIGAMVVTKEYLAALKLEAEINPPDYDRRLAGPVGMMVIERGLQQCHGGIQGFYTVRRWGTDHSERMVRFIEHELASWDEVAAVIRTIAEADRKARNVWADVQRPRSKVAAAAARAAAAVAAEDVAEGGSGPTTGG